jgi:hypothetical protein
MNHKHLSLIVLEVRKLKIKVLIDSEYSAGCFLVHRWLSLIVFSHSERGFQFSRSSLSNHLTKGPPPNSVTLGFRISTYEFLRGKNIQSITNIVRGKKEQCIRFVKKQFEVRLQRASMNFKVIFAF